VPDDIHYVGGIATIQHGKTRIESQVACKLAQQSIADRMEGTGPLQANRGAAVTGLPPRFPDDALDAPGHLLGRPACKRQEQDAIRIDARHDQVRHAMGKGHGLPGAGPGNDQERPASHTTICHGLAVAGCLPLSGIQPGKSVLAFGYRYHADLL
jgi:hypothetical protein